MNVLKRVSYCLIPLFMCNSCSDMEDSIQFPTSEKVIELSSESMEMVSSDNKFGIDIFKRVLYADPDKNVMLSPLSISQALLMVYNGADGETKKAFEQCLNLNNLTVKEINQAQKELVSALLDADPSIVLDNANSIWLRDDFTVKPEFIRVNSDYYDAEVNQLTFNQNAIAQINKWVSNKTKGKIDKIIEEMDSQAIMYLINAVYFNGKWKYMFEESNTSNSPFYLEGKSEVSVPFMNQTTNAGYMIGEGFEALELPYGRGNFSMMIFLPKEDKTLEDLLDILNIDNYGEWLGQFEKTNVDVSIPKFKFAYENNLNYMLKAMNLSIAFDAERADFSKINDEMQLFINKVKHKSFIEVNEKGTEAAAVTSVEMYTTSTREPEHPQFIANKPFLFLIREKYTNSIVFMGKLEDPTKE